MSGEYNMWSSVNERLYSLRAAGDRKNTRWVKMPLFTWNLALSTIVQEGIT